MELLPTQDARLGRLNLGWPLGLGMSPWEKPARPDTNPGFLSPIPLGLCSLREAPSQDSKGGPAPLTPLGPWLREPVPELEPPHPLLVLKSSVCAKGRPGWNGGRGGRAACSASGHFSEKLTTPFPEWHHIPLGLGKNNRFSHRNSECKAPTRAGRWLQPGSPWKLQPGRGGLFPLSSLSPPGGQAGPGTLQRPPRMHLLRSTCQ